MSRFSALLLSLLLTFGPGGALPARSQDLAGAIRAEASRRGGELAAWYQARNHAPIWSGERLAGLAQFIRELNAHGLAPELFSFSQWDASWRNPDPNPAVRASIEVGTTHLALFAIQSAAYGFVDPSTVHPKWSEVPRKVSAYDFLNEALRQDPRQLGSFLIDKVPPQDERYREMITTLARYRQIASYGGWRNLPATARPAGVGSEYPELKLLRSRLQAEGDLPPSTVRYRSKTIDQQTADAIKSFQFRHGIEPDGYIGQASLVELNTPVEERVNMLVINIDRLRWMPRAYEQVDHIEVNIAESALRVFDRKRRLTTMPVIVGVKGKHQTPVFHDKMDYLIFRPYWNVPVSIARKELVPEARSDPDGYFRKHDYQIVRYYDAPYSEILSPTQSNLDKLAAGSLLMRQGTGPDNALGLVKFIFPNDSSVYLHDTPDHSLFQRADRDFSHGCVRVSRPDELADIVLQRNGGWNIQTVRQAMQDTNNPNNRVDLEPPMPVYLIYWTSTIMGDGRVRFDQDIYGHDETMYQRFGIR